MSSNRGSKFLSKDNLIIFQLCQFTAKFSKNISFFIDGAVYLHFNGLIYTRGEEGLIGREEGLIGRL